MAIFPSSMPYDDVAIYDQSEYIEEQAVEPVPTIPSGPIALCPFISPRGYGKDGKLLYMTSARLAKYGTPNLEKYGLSLYLANRFLNGGGSIVGIRVVPNGAKCASNSVYALIENRDFVNIESVASPTYGAADIYLPVWIDANDGNNTKTFNSISIDDPYDLTSIVLNGDKVISSTSDGAIVEDVITITNTNLKTFKDEDTEYVIAYLSEKKEDNKESNNVYILTRTLKNPDDASVGYTYTIKYLLSREERWTIEYRIVGDESELNLPTGYVKITDKHKQFDSDMKYYCPVFKVSALAAGKFGNAFAYRLVADDTMNQQVSNSTFFYKFIDSDNNAKLDNNMTFTFNDDYIYNGEPMSAEDVFSEYSENIVLEKDEKDKGFNHLARFIESQIKLAITNGKIDPISDDEIESKVYSYDILFGSNTSNIGISVYMNPNYDRLNQNTGVKLTGGLDGTEGEKWDWDNDIFAEDIAKVYRGEVTDLIYDEVRFPYTYIFAPSYNDDVVSAIRELVDVRRITRANYFGPKPVEGDTYTTILNKISNMELDKVNSWKETLNVEWGEIRDPYSGKKRLMPSVWFDSYFMPDHWITKPGIPYAGPANYRWSGFTIGSLCPATVRDTQYIANHNNGINTMCEDGIGYASPYEQITAQQKKTTSQLSEINNAITLVEMVRIALRIAKERRWTTLNDSDISEYKSIVEQSIALSLSPCYRGINVIAERESVNGAGRNRIHCKINVTFNDMLKGVSYEFYILAN